MATVKEMMPEAAHSIDTSYTISAGDVFAGEITRGDEDWIKIEMSEGKKYTITVGGDTETAGALNDSILKLMDGKGGLVDMNDDTDPAKGKLGSQLTFTPEVGSGTQTYYISVSGYSDNPGAVNTGTYTLSVTAIDVLPTGEGADIPGTPNADKLTGTADGESIAGEGGNDTIYGGGGDDSLSGGAGADLLVGGPGADTLRGGSSMYDSDGDGTNDTEHRDTISYMGSPMGVTINLNDGTARGGHAEGDDLGTDIENVMGSDHDDTITGTDDVNVGNSLWGLGGNDVLSGREGEDMLYGGAGDDMLDGGDENDTLEGGYGADELTGGLGDDTASYAGSMMGVTVRLHSSQTMGGDAEGDTWGDTATVEYSMPAEDPEDPPVLKEETVPDIVHLTGSHMADILAGDSRDNTIMGMGGDDEIYGGPGGGDDNLQGGGGNDMLFGGIGNDDLHGGGGNDMLSGGPGDDDYYGGAGSDMIYDMWVATDSGTISGAAMADDDMTSFNEMTGNAPGENDTLSYARNKEGVTIDLNLARFVSIETLIGTDEDDVLTGTATASETIEGGDGADNLIGGAGMSDTVSYENSDRGVRVDLAGGQDALGDDNTARASGGHASGDEIAGFENVRGSAFDDNLTALTGTETTDETVTATGSTLWGLDGDDSLEGGFGNDTIEGGAGADEMDGGTSQAIEDATVNTQVNTLSYASSDAGVTVNLVTATASGGHAQGDEIETYEYLDTKGDEDDEEIDVATFVNVTGSMHNDHLTGDRFDNHLEGGAGDDNLRSGAGADVLAGGPGADKLDGGSSNSQEFSDGGTPDDDQDDIAAVAHEDWAAYRGAMGGVMVNLNTGMGTGGDAMGDTLKNIELIWGSMHDDTFIASEGVDIIHGDGGSDTVSYEASKHGIDVTLAGNTTAVLGADGTPTSTYSPAIQDQVGTADVDESMPEMFNAATDAMLMNWRAGGGDGGTAATDRPAAVQEAGDGGATNKSYAKGDILASIENVTGSRSDDKILGGTVVVPNVLKGGGGNDTLSGGGGNDKLHGGAGNDILGARPAIDDDPDTTDVVETEDALADPGNDMMYGDAGNDKLYGGDGNDTLVGGAGDDDMDGGDGVDTFVFGPGDGSDVIVNFIPNETAGNATTDRDGDFIDLSAFGIKAGDLAGLLSERAGNVVVNLEDYGGGRITIQDETIADLEAVGLAHVDTNGDTAGVGTEDGASSGIFIL